MRWTCLHIHSYVYVLLAVNAVMKLPLYDGIMVASYLTLAIVSYMIHRPHP